MTKLVVLFLVAGQWVQLDGWGDREYDSMDDCSTAAFNTLNYINNEVGLPGYAESVQVGCYNL